MNIEIKSEALRARLRSHLDRIETSGQRMLITRHGKPVAALVSPRDLAALEKVDQTREVFAEARHRAQMQEFRMMKDVLDGKDG